jgi:hypothetical protein
MIYYIMYQNKYIKYKTKYLNLKNEMYGGNITDLITELRIKGIKQLLETELYKNSIDVDKKKISLEAVKSNGFELKNVEEQFQNDKEIVIAAIRQNPNALEYASIDLKGDEDIVKPAIFSRGQLLSFVSEKLKNNKKIVLIAVTNDQNALQYASAELKRDTNLLDLLRNDVSEKLLIDKAIALHVIKKSKGIPIYLPKEYFTDRKIATAVARYTINISDFEKKFSTFLNDQEIALIVVTNKGYNLSIFGKTIKSNYNIALAAVTQDGDALKFVDSSLLTTVENNPIVLAAVKQKGTALQWVSDDFKSNYNIALAAVTQDGDALKFVDKKLIDNNYIGKMIVLAAVKQKGTALQWAPEKFKSDFNVALVAVNNNNKAMEFVDKVKLKADDLGKLNAIENK